MDLLTEVVVVLVALILLLLLLLLLLVVEVAAEDEVVLVAMPLLADVVVVGPLEAVLVMEAELRAALSAGGVEIGMGDEMGGGGGVGSGADAISADTFGVFGVLTGGGCCGTGPFGVRLGDGEGIGTLLPDEFSRSPLTLVGVEGICRLLLVRCC